MNVSVACITEALMTAMNDLKCQGRPHSKLILGCHQCRTDDNTGYD